jgi:cell cycle sensor histidine kinase DivJ
VKGLVSLHGGDMQVRSELGKGTVISIHLPIDCEAKATHRRKGGALTTLEMPRKQSDIQVRKSA